MTLQNPLVLPELGVKRVLLETLQPQRKPGPHLLQSHLRLILKLVPVMANENIVSLVVEGDNPATVKVRIELEQRGEQPTDRKTQPRFKVIHHDLGFVGRILRPVLNLLAILDIADPEERCWAFG